MYLFLLFGALFSPNTICVAEKMISSFFSYKQFICVFCLPLTKSLGQIMNRREQGSQKCYFDKTLRKWIVKLKEIFLINYILIILTM